MHVGLGLGIVLWLRIESGLSYTVVWKLSQM